MSDMEPMTLSEGMQRFTMAEVARAGCFSEEEKPGGGEALRRGLLTSVVKGMAKWGPPPDKKCLKEVLRELELVMREEMGEDNPERCVDFPILGGEGKSVTIDALARDMEKCWAEGYTPAWKGYLKGKGPGFLGFDAAPAGEQSGGKGAQVPVEQPSPAALPVDGWKTKANTKGQNPSWLGKVPMKKPDPKASESAFKKQEKKGPGGPGGGGGDDSGGGPGDGGSGSGGPTGGGGGYDPRWAAGPGPADMRGVREENLRQPPGLNPFPEVDLATAEFMLQKFGGKIYSVYHPPDAFGVYLGAWSRLVATWKDVNGQSKFRFDEAIRSLTPGGVTQSSASQEIVIRTCL